MSVRAKDDCDAASAFLILLESREKRDPGSVKQIYWKLSECVEFIATHQEHFDADPDIYGDFPDKAEAIRRLCS
jgi:hypothetical protein